MCSLLSFIHALRFLSAFDFISSLSCASSLLFFLLPIYPIIDDVRLPPPSLETESDEDEDDVFQDSLDGDAYPGESILNQLQAPPMQSHHGLRTI